MVPADARGELGRAEPNCPGLSGSAKPDAGRVAAEESGGAVGRQIEDLEHELRVSR